MNTNFTPAFPTWIADDSMCPGMTLRDYFAAMALNGSAVGDGDHIEDYKMCAEYCYALADAMMEARK